MYVVIGPMTEGATFRANCFVLFLRRLRGALFWSLFFVLVGLVGLGLVGLVGFVALLATVDVGSDVKDCLGALSLLLFVGPIVVGMCGNVNTLNSGVVKAEEVGKEEVLCFFSFFLCFFLFFLVALVFVFFSDRVLCVCACRTGVNIDVIDEEDNMFVGITL